MAKGTEETISQRVEKERSGFLSLIAGNPNYFGNLTDSAFKASKKIVGNTKYEELTCVGFNFNLNTLEATIQIKLPVGYGGSLCQPGSTEYVRFYLDYGAGWEDAGVVSFNAHDIPNSTDCAKKPTKPLSYVLTREAEPKRKFCGTPVLPKVRAILSWNLEPPPGLPNWPPVWGNVLERHIQIKPRPWNLVDVVDVLGTGIAKKLELPVEIEEVKLNPIPVPDPPPLALSELVKLYGEGSKGSAKTSVEPQRFGLDQLHIALSAGGLSQQALSAKITEWQSVGLDWASAFSALEQTSGNTTYEQLNCLGLDYNREWLVATFSVKKPLGYGGSLCKKGSLEHVAFWADWDDTCEWEYLDTVSINVHDIASIPATGLHYAAIIKANLSSHRQPCKKPKIGRVRAVLSWNTLPSTVDPDAIPFYGNRIDTHVQIRPGTVTTGLEPEIHVIGGISVADINIFGNGMTKPNVVFALFGGFADPHNPVRSCPFGGRIHVQAFAPPLFHLLGLKYRIMARTAAGPGSPNPVTTHFQIASGIAPPVMRIPDPVTGFVTYVDPSQNIFDMLGWWEPAGDELWEIQVEMWNSSETVQLGATPWHRVQLDNTQPEAEITMDAGPCEEFNPGVTITGKFVARDPVGFGDHFGVYSLDTLPNSVSPPDPTPTSGVTQTASSPGNVWSLNTTGMTPCGYVIVLNVWDRTIVGSMPGSHNHRPDDVGFCLLKP